MNQRLSFFSFGLVLFLSLLIKVATAGEPTRTKRSLKTEKGRVFIIKTNLRDLNAFRELVKQSLVLKPYGTVKIDIGGLADKSFHEIPKNGSSWHEYASSNPTPFKFFPDPKLAPFLPSEFVKRNKQLILEKAKILREYGLEAAFVGYEPNFMPGAFFEAHPEMLGPRVDHPRRSTEKAFAPCINVPETQEMYASMMAEMLKNVPEITAFAFKTNDAGAGICWSEWLYTGPNGPSNCKHFTMGERVKMLMDAYMKGAERAGRKLSIYLNDRESNFSDAERADISANLPENCYFIGDESREIEYLGGGFSSLTYPVTNIINPVSLLNRSRPLHKNINKTIVINFNVAYGRAADQPEATKLVLDLIEKRLKDTSIQETLPALEEVRRLSEEWAGKKSGNVLFNAFVALDEAMKYKSATFPRVLSLYWGVSERLITRPLVIAPQRLTQQEEAYFLPFVFNVVEQEARMDYMDIHGGRASIQPGVVENYVRRLKSIAAMLENLDETAPKRDFFRKMATSLRMHGSIMRSCGNFAAAQVIRDRNRDMLQVPAKRPDKEFNFTGHPDFIAFNNIMRDELDNTNELIELLEKGGSKLIVIAGSGTYEDRFMLGPDLVGQLKKKRKIMWDHWQDIEDYLASPLK